MKFDFEKEKNEILIRERNISFYQVIETIAEKGILLNVEHPNRIKYPGQYMMVIEFDDYTYCVPYVKNGETMFLKTIYPNREFMYLLEEKNEN